MAENSINENHLAASNNQGFITKVQRWERTILGSTSEDGSSNYVHKEDIANYNVC